MAKFEPGQIVATRSIAERMENDREFAAAAGEALARHLSGDWGELDPEDVAANDDALKTGARLLSAYRIQGDKIWIITEAEDEKGVRIATTLLYPSEY